MKPRSPLLALFVFHSRKHARTHAWRIANNDERCGLPVTRCIITRLWRTGRRDLIWRATVLMIRAGHVRGKVVVDGRWL